VNPDDPGRLASSSETSEKGVLGELLHAGRKDLPSQAQLAALAAKLGPILGPMGGGPGGGGAAPAVKAAGVSAVAKGAGTLAVLAIVVGGIVATRTRRVPSASSPSARATPVVAVSAPVESVDPAAPAATVAQRPEPSAASTAKAPRVAETPSTLDEVTLLERAEDALATSPAHALALCDQDASLFPRGLLRQEAEVIAIDALVRLGRHAEADARAASFRKAYPTSTHQRRIDMLLGRGD
jgi:hypothetical protein